MRVLAIDWSGKNKREEEFLWLAEVCDGQLVSLQNGFTREQLIEKVVASAEKDPDTVVGLDFAFSFPRWWCLQRGWCDVQEVWAAMAADGDELLEACELPLWGRPGKPNPHPPDRRFRRTEREDGGGMAKSVFQIGGAGAVGTGSIRGMPHLITLARHGFGIWPFDGAPRPLVIEIYPRALTGPVKKNKWTARREFLDKHFPEQSAPMRERAAGSEDSFDAAVSALVIAAQPGQLAALEQLADPYFAIEVAGSKPAAPICEVPAIGLFCLAALATGRLGISICRRSRPAAARSGGATRAPDRLALRHGALHPYPKRLVGGPVFRIDHVSPSRAQ